MTPGPPGRGRVVRLKPRARGEHKNEDREEKNRRDINRAAPHHERAERLHGEEESHGRESEEQRREHVSGGRDRKNKPDREHHKKDKPQRHKQKPLAIHGSAKGIGRSIHASMVARGG